MVSELSPSLGGEATPPFTPPSVPAALESTSGFVSQDEAGASVVNPPSNGVVREPSSPPTKKKAKKQKYVTVNIPKEQFDDLKRLAKAQKKRAAQLVREWIYEAVSKEEKQTPA